LSKKIIDNNEVQLFLFIAICICAFLFITSITIAGVFHLDTYLNNSTLPLFIVFLIYLALLFFGVILIFIAMVSHILILRLLSRKLPLKCLYNIQRDIEIHIGKKYKAGRKDFIKGCADIILLAYKDKRNIIFTTNLVRPDNIKKLLNSSVEIRKTSLLENINIMLFISKKSRVKNKQFMRYYVETSKITSQELTNLEMVRNY
jgi:hypothetical protein